MSDQADFDATELNLDNILERFDPSVKGKFERCANTAWCASEENFDSEAAACLAVKAAGKSKQHRNTLSRLCRKSKLVRKIAKKLENIRVKLLKNKSPRRVKITSDRSIEEQICQGSNTPAHSRPSSISTTMDQIENSTGKHVEYANQTDNSMLCGES
jgi:uncharacterized protein (UPF0147 family)